MQNNLSASIRSGGRTAIAATLLGGIVAGTIDIAAACLITQRSVPFILQTVAGGLLGKASFEGGATSVLVGALLQEIMGILIAAIFVAASRKLPALKRRWVGSGLLYGVVIFFVMNYVVVPLSAWHVVPHFTVFKFVANLAAMLLFGLIVAYFAKRA